VGSSILLQYNVRQRIPFVLDDSHLDLDSCHFPRYRRFRTSGQSTRRKRLRKCPIWVAASVLSHFHGVRVCLRGDRHFGCRTVLGRKVFGLALVPFHTS
jgi:hypothetical protein